MQYTSIRPGQLWLDTEGKRIQAHGGSLFFWEGVFYWYGENKEKTLPGSGIWHWGVRCYSSHDLYNWKDEGLILSPTPDDRSCPLHPSRTMDRPHILYNKKTEKFVMWVKFAGTETDPWDGQYMGIATADSILGPFQLIKTIHPLGMNSGDFDLVIDPSDGKAYFYFERVHSELICADLTEDYMDVSGYYSTHFPRISPPYVREAPAFFHRRGISYLFTSGTTGYFPNPSEVACARTYHGPWNELGDPHVGDESHTSFHSQITSVFRHPGKKELYIALADRWLTDLPEDYPDMQELFSLMFSEERDPQKAQEAAQLLHTLTKENTSVADYVWLPVEFEGDKPVLRWKDEWKIEDYR